MSSQLKPRSYLIATLYWLLHALFSFVLRLFFRTIETHGLEALPNTNPTVFVANHPNGMLDPIVIATRLRRRVYLTVKSTFSRGPILKSLLSLLGSVYLYRDREFRGTLALGRNADAFREFANRLRKSGALILFPEGGSHSDLRLHSFKPGVALIAQAYAASTPNGRALHIVPIGLCYESKARFRSGVCVNFGDPLVIPAGAPLPPETGQGLTRVLEERVAALTLNYESRSERRGLTVLRSLALAESFSRGARSATPPLSEELSAAKVLQSLLRTTDAGRRRSALLFRKAMGISRRLQTMNLLTTDLYIILHPTLYMKRAWTSCLLALLLLPFLAIGWISIVPVLPFLKARRPIHDYEDWAANQVFLAAATLPLLLVAEMAVALFWFPAPLNYVAAIFMLLAFIVLPYAIDHTGYALRLLRLASTLKSASMNDLRREVSEVFAILHSIRPSSRVG